MGYSELVFSHGICLKCHLACIRACTAQFILAAAHAGNVEAQLAFAVMHGTDLDQPKDRVQSMGWLKKSEVQNCPSAVAALEAEPDTKAD